MPDGLVTSRRLVWTLGAVCALGFGLRCWALGFGLPGVYNPDEIPILNRALAFAKGDPNPHNFLYPSLQFYALFLWELLFFVVGRLAGWFTSLDAFRQEYFTDPSRLILAGRALTALCGTATILVVYRFGARLYDRGVGVAGAVFMAVAPFAVRDAHYVKLDVPVTLLTAMTHAALARIVVDPAAAARRRSWIVAGLLGGLAVSTHYYVVFIVVPFAAVAAVQAVRSRDWAHTSGLLASAAAAVAAGFLIGTPFIVAEPRTALRDISGVREVDIDRALAGGGPFTSLGPYARMLLHDAMGWPVCIAAVVGAVASLVSDWRRGILLIAFPLAFLAFISHTVPENRYVNAMLPMLAVAAAWAIVTAARAASRAPLAAAAVVGLAAVPGLLGSIHSDRFFNHADTRTLARTFIERTIPPGASVLIQPYSAPIHPSRDSVLEALQTNLGDPARASIKFQLELAVSPYPVPAYRTIFLGEGGMDADKLYVLPREFRGGAGLQPLRQRGIEYVVLKRTNVDNPAMAPLEAALAHEARLLATFSPYRPGVDAARLAAVPPFFHNTAARIDPALDRPGPIIDIWQLP
jgi:hypothetical protein